MKTKDSEQRGANQDKPGTLTSSRKSRTLDGAIGNSSEQGGPGQF